AIVVALVGVFIAGGAIAGAQRLTPKRNVLRYITRPVAYGDISATVTETGTVNPVDTVQVGTQVSGTVAALNVDYNSRVTKGEVLATLDPTQFQAAAQQSGANLAAAKASYAAALSAIAQDQASLRSAQANATKAQAQLALAELTVGRDESLLRQGFIPQSQMDADQTAVKAATDDSHAAEAAVAVAEALVKAAQVSVTAFPNVVFSGTVQQLRINPTIVQNVVTYDAVVIVHDSSGRLFPGMTGQVTIDVATRRHVLAVPTAALLFRPLPQRNAPSAPPGGGGLFGFGTPTNGTAP